MKTKKNERFWCRIWGVVATFVIALPLLLKWSSYIIVIELYVVLSIPDLLPWVHVVPWSTLPPPELSHWTLFHSLHIGPMFLYLLDFHKQNLDFLKNIPPTCTWGSSHQLYIELDFLQFLYKIFICNFQMQCKLVEEEVRIANLEVHIEPLVTI